MRIEFVLCTICNRGNDNKQTKSSGLWMFREFFYRWEAVPESITREKVEKHWNCRPAFFSYGNSTNSSANSTTLHPRSTQLTNATLRFLLTNCLAPRFCACEWRYVSVEVQFPARISAQPVLAASSLFPRAKFKQVLLRYDISECTTYIHVRAGCLAVETYCTVCTSTWSFAVIHLARRVYARCIGKRVSV